MVRRVASRILDALGTSSVADFTNICQGQTVGTDAEAFAPKEAPPPPRLGRLISLLRQLGFSGGWPLVVLNIGLIFLRALRIYLAFSASIPHLNTVACLDGVWGGQWRVLAPWICLECCQVVDFASMSMMHSRVGASIWSVTMTAERWAMAADAFKEIVAVFTLFFIFWCSNFVVFQNAIGQLPVASIVVDLCGRFILDVLVHPIMSGCTFTFVLKLLSQKQSQYLKTFREGVSKADAVALLEQLNDHTFKCSNAIHLCSIFAPVNWFVALWLIYDYLFMPWGNWGHLALLGFFVFIIVPGFLWDYICANQFREELTRLVMAESPRCSWVQAGEFTIALEAGVDDRWSLQDRLEFCEFVNRSTYSFDIFGVTVDHDLMRKMAVQAFAIWVFLWEIRRETEWAGFEGYRGRVPLC